MKDDFNPESVWAEFYKKYSFPLSEDSKRQNLYNKKLTEEEKVQYDSDIKEKKSFEESVIKIQKRWRLMRQKDTLVRVGLKGNHSPEFNELVHGQRVQKNINVDKLNDLLKAIEKGDWEEKIFSDEYLPQLTLSLFAARKISQQQVNTILEFCQIRALIPQNQELSRESVLDSENSFTYSALALFQKLAHQSHFKALASTQLEELRLLISQLPISEQSIMAFEIKEYSQAYALLMEGASKPHSLALTLMTLYAIPNVLYGDQIILIYFPAGIRDALGIVRFGVKNYVRMVPTFGEKTPHEIETGIRQKKRFGALSFPLTVPYKAIHDFKSVDPLEATGHDIYHAATMSAYGVEVQNAIIDFIDLIREVIAADIKPQLPELPVLSKEIWGLIDGEFSYMYSNCSFYHHKKFRKNILPAHQITQNFCDSLANHPDQSFVLETTLDDSKKEISLIGIMLILDILKNPEKWQKHKIDFSQIKQYRSFLDQPNTVTFLEYYVQIEQLKKHILTDPLKIQIFKVFLYQAFKSQTDDPVEFTPFSQLITRNSLEILGKLRFKKMTSAEIKSGGLNPSLKNTIFLAYDGQRVSTKLKQDKAIIESIVRSYYKP